MAAAAERFLVELLVIEKGGSWRQEPWWWVVVVTTAIVKMSRGFNLKFHIHPIRRL